MYPLVNNYLPTIQTLGTRLVGLDLEYIPETSKPTILGASVNDEVGSVRWSSDCVRWLNSAYNLGSTFVGHNVLDADRPIVDRELGFQTDLNRWEDTIILTYLCNSEFVSIPKSSFKDESVTEAKGIGLMNLWATAALYTDLPQWKRCRGDYCSGPCPQHDVHGYNGIDALSGELMFPLLTQERNAKGILNALYQRLKTLMVMTREMRLQGVTVDLPLIENLQGQFVERKAALFHSEEQPKTCGVCGRMKTGGPCKRCKEGRGPTEDVWVPYNPQAPKGALEYFQEELGFNLSSWTKEEIFNELNKSEPGAVRDALSNAYEYKAIGKGTDAWFDLDKLGRDGRFHPRFNPLGSATGRFSSAGPNFQNLPHVDKDHPDSLMSQMRRAVVPRDPSLKLLKADYKQIELRICLWYAFVETLNKPFPQIQFDAFDWLVEQAPGAFDRASELLNRTPRYIAKTLSHAGNYLEGLQLLDETHRASSNNQTLVSQGALEIHYDWTYQNNVVAFNGVNLASRLFGSATRENRKRALEIQNVYFDLFPQIRQWQQCVVEEAEGGYVQSASTRYLELVSNNPQDRLKTGVAMKGQGAVDYMQEAMIKYYAMGHIPLLTVHDELVFEVPREWTDARCWEFLKVMEEPSKIFEGFSCPISAEVGENWLDMSALKV